MTTICALGLGVALVRWFGLTWAKFLLIGMAVGLAAWLAPGYPAVAFTVGIVGLSVVMSSDEGELGQWLQSSWGFAKQILPLLFAGVLVAGLLLGRPDSEGLVPAGWVSSAVGGNSLAANLFASVAGAFMYFATLTEVPILEGLLRNGMGRGPALALLLAGPALSLPNMLVIGGVMGVKKTATFCIIIVIMSTIAGMLYGYIAG